MTTRKLLTALQADVSAILTPRSFKNVLLWWAKAQPRFVTSIVAVFALVLGLQAHAQRQGVTPPQVSAEFLRAVGECSTTQSAVTTWPGSGRWSDPDFPGHGWELTWYTPEEPVTTGMTARLRLHFYTYSSLGSTPANPADPVVGQPVWYYADLLPIVSLDGMIFANGTMYKVTRDASGTEMQQQVATVSVGQNNPAITGGIARSRASVAVNDFADPDEPGALPGSKLLCLQKLGANQSNAAYGAGHEGTWRSGGSFQSPGFRGINLWSEPVSGQYSGTLLTFNAAGKPVWLANLDPSAGGTSLTTATGVYSLTYLRGRPMFFSGDPNPCPTNGTVCLTAGHVSSVQLTVLQAAGERPGMARITPSINIPGSPDTNADPASCTGFSSTFAATSVAPINCRPSARVTWNGVAEPIWQNTKLADMVPFSACVVASGATSCDQRVQYAMRKGLDERYLVFVNQLNEQIVAASGMLSVSDTVALDNGIYTNGFVTLPVNVGARLKAVLVTGPPSAAVVGQHISGLRVFKSSPEFTIAFPALSVPVVTAQLQVGSTTTVGLSWGAVVGANAYYWRRVATATGVIGPDTGVAITTATDAPGDGIFRYEVKACNANGCSGYGQSANVTVGAIALDEWSTLTPNLPVAPVQDVPVPAFADGNLEVGSASGSFRVDESGQTSYQMPIATAPATGGMAPEMSISYNSGSQDGYLGVGFQISGLSAITRCRKTVETDALTSPIGVVVDYMDDAFC